MNAAEKIDYALFCEDVALKLWGAPSESTDKELRWGTNGSRALDRRTGRWFDHEAKEGGSTIELLKRELNLSFAEATAWLRSEGMIGAAPGRKGIFSKIVATYDYVDEDGAVLFQVVRFEPKTFRQRRPDGHGGWTWSVKDVRPVPYRLPALLEALAQDKPVFIVEGEKDVDNLAELGIHATTNAGGVGKWRAEYSELLRGVDAILIPDNDDAGRDHMQAVAASLNGVAKRIRVLSLPDLSAKADVSDWLEDGGTAEALWSMVEAAPDWAPSETKGNQDRSWRDNVFTAAALKHETFPEIMFVIPDVIPEGLTILAGRPKVGKSWLGLDVCIAVASGTYCLGDKHPEQGDVLYCALEDNRRRLQRRITKLLKVYGAKWPERLQLATDWRRLDKGGVQDLREWIEDHPKARLIILDTFAGVKPIRTTQGYQEDYQSLEELQHLAGEMGIAIIVLHHTRKMEAEDPIDTVSGTLGLAGCADCVMVINRTSQGVTLYVRGRDVEEAEHAISFDKHTCRWTILGNASDVHRSNERGKILAILESATELMGPQDIAAAAAMPVNNVKQLLFKMTEKGEVQKVSRGQYAHPSRSDLMPQR